MNTEKEIRASNEFWLRSLEKIFGILPPLTATWKSPQGITDILSTLTDISHTYILLPEGGGIHFGKAALSQETPCIEIYPFSFPDGKLSDRSFIVHAKALHYFKPGKDLTWSYFLLEAKELQPILHYPKSTSRPEVSEEVFVMDSGHYRKTPDNDFTTVRKVANRRLISGLYMIVNANSLYRQIANLAQPEHQTLGIDDTFKTMQSLYATYEHQYGTANFTAAFNAQQ